MQSNRVIADTIITVLDDGVPIISSSNTPDEMREEEEKEREKINIAFLFLLLHLFKDLSPSLPPSFTKINAETKSCKSCNFGDPTLSAYKLIAQNTQI